MFGNIVLKIEKQKFEVALEALKKERVVEEDPELSGEDLEELIETYKGIVEEEVVIKKVLGEDHPVEIGTMIELPRACATAGEIAEKADFFSFGTNDLTQTTCGLFRDDAEGGFLAEYLEEGILEKNPFETLDRDGVGKLVSMACELGREANPGLKLGICGEPGGDPESVHFFHEAGLDYVSCSPYRVPVARLAAAQAALGGDPKTES